MKNDPNCTLCRLHRGANTVCLLGTGPKQSDIMIIGEAPTHTEDKRGRTIASKELMTLLDRNDIDLGDVYLANAVSCHPKGKKPGKREVAACSKWLQAQIKQVRPKYILTMGASAYLSITGETGIKKKRGKPFEKDGVVYLPTFDPRVALWDARASYHVEKDFAFFKEIIEFGGIPREKGVNLRIVKTRKDLKDMLADLRGEISFDVETTCLYPWGEWKYNKKKEPIEFIKPEIVTMGFGTRRTQWVLPTKPTGWGPFGKNKETPQWIIDEIGDILEKIEERLADCVVVGHNAKFDFLWVWVQYGFQWHRLFDFDTMLAHYILDENDWHGLDYLAKKYFGAPDYDVGLEVKQGKTTLEENAIYLAHDIYYTRNLSKKFRKLLAQDGEVKRVFNEIMMPCSRLFVEVEYDGVAIDVTKMDDAEKYLREELCKAEAEMRPFVKQFERHQGEALNWGSPKQVGAFLFGPRKTGGLGIAVIERTAKGGISTSESVIKRIEHDIGPAILKYRGAKQQLSFFIEGWRPFLHKTGTAVYLHPSFKLHGTVTGRLSCEHPNLQQVPRDKRIRQLITAPEGWTLLEADLSQIELRVAAELAQEPTMLDAFRRGIDVHWLTATRELQRGGGGKHAGTIIKTAEAYLKKQGKPKKLRFNEAMQIVIDKISPSVAEELQAEWGEKDPEMLWKEIRKKAKAVNFGYLYGMWWKKFKIYARDNYGVKLSDGEAEASREFFFATFPVFAKWHNRQRRYAQLNGYVRSLSGRKRRLPAAMLGEDVPERREAQRQAINSPVQSFANEINLMAAIQLRKEFNRSVARIVGTVHDALLVWVKNEHVEAVGTRLLEIMSRPELFDTFEIDLSVPVMAEAKVGAWGVGIDFYKWVKQNEGSSHRRAGRVSRASVHGSRTPRGNSHSRNPAKERISRHVHRRQVA